MVQIGFGGNLELLPQMLDFLFQLTVQVFKVDESRLEQRLLGLIRLEIGFDAFEYRCRWHLQFEHRFDRQSLQSERVNLSALVVTQGR